MKKWFGLSLVVGVTALLAACATTGSPKLYRQTIDSWNGASAVSLFGSWGYPSKTKSLPDGKTEYIYNYDHVVHQPIYKLRGAAIDQTYGDQQYDANQSAFVGGKTIHRRCKTWFIVNQNNQIESAHFDGNACLADQQFYQAKANP